ncbi:MAG: hypothetical protein R6U85_11445 [Salinivirgaceae bacterium]
MKGKNGSPTWSRAPISQIFLHGIAGIAACGRIAGGVSYSLLSARPLRAAMRGASLNPLMSETLTCRFL